ncbi:MAG: SgcJ/EcaC family oxidoreductase [Planctomycetota bacterium]|jgi:uncharacterized protein (TIGR02246 family)
MIRRLSPILLLVAVAGCAATADSPPVRSAAPGAAAGWPAERAVRAVVAAQQSALNRHDVEASLALFTPDGEIKSSWGAVHARGAEQLRQLHEFAFETVFADAIAQVVVEDVAFLTPRLAIVYIRARVRFSNQSWNYRVRGLRLLVADADGAWRIRLQDDTQVHEEAADAVERLRAELAELPEAGPSPPLDHAEPGKVEAAVPAIGRVVAGHAAAATAGDARALADHLTDDSELTSATGQIHARGPEQVVHVASWHHGRGLEIRNEVDEIVLLHDRIALVHLEELREFGDGGASHAAGTRILVRGEDGRWRIRLHADTLIQDDPPPAMRELARRLDEK